MKVMAERWRYRRALKPRCSRSSTREDFLKRRCDAVLAKLKEGKLVRRFEERLGAMEAAAVQLAEAAEKLQAALRTLAASGKKAQASRKQVGKTKPKRG